MRARYCKGRLNISSQQSSISGLSALMKHHKVFVCSDSTIGLKRFFTCDVRKLLQN